MTSIANPDYKFYKKLEGTWTDEKGTCEAVLTSGCSIEICYASEKLAPSYGVSDAWYGKEELHLEMMDLYDGHTENVVLTRVKTEEAPLAEGEYQCVCGYRGEVGRFCPECGRAVT